MTIDELLEWYNQREDERQAILRCVADPRARAAALSRLGRKSAIPGARERQEMKLAGLKAIGEADIPF